MPNSIPDGATIRIGIQNRNYKLISDPEYLGVMTHSIKINKKTILTGKGSNHKDYIKYCKESAEEIAEIMKEKNVKKYIVINGERVRFSNYKWESCDYIPNDGEELFKKTLEKKLSEKN